MIVSLAPEAEGELIEGARYYADHGNSDLGLAFIAEFERALEVLRAHPNLGSIWRTKTRRFPLRHFPYSILYRIKGEELRVIALAHQRRRPSYWSGRR